MDLFTALAEPTRRRIVEMLAKDARLPASQISASFSVSAPAISQHLKVLREAGAVTVEKQAQQRLYSINQDAMRKLENWAHRMAERYEERFSALDAVLEEEQAKEPLT